MAYIFRKIHVVNVHPASSSHLVKRNCLDKTDWSFLAVHVADVCRNVQAGRAYILDASSQEETCMESAIQLAVSSSGALCGLFKRGPSAVNPAVLQVCM